MVLLEGADGTGKSTLARYINSFTCFPIIKSPGRFPETAKKERMFWSNELLKIRNVIVDRISPVSQFVYDEALNGSSMITEEETCFFIEEFFKRSGNIFVYCKIPDLPHIKDRNFTYLHVDFKEACLFDKIVDVNISAIKERYENYVNNYVKSNIRCVEGKNFLQVTGRNKDYALSEIISMLYKN